MTLISFQHSIKYIYLQLAPYTVLTIASGCMAYSMSILWLMIYLTLSAVLIWRLIALTAVQYFFTPDMLVVSKGVICKTVECRAIWQLKGTDIRFNTPLSWLHVSHIHCGLEGPPADRIRIIGVDNHSMLQVLQQLKEGIAANKEMWRNYFQPENI
ncbi:hypothetical protein DIU31_031820 [Mucilaginibacter rubeus]|uniref:Uncharacterized protein n=1 Tax=Mucilaginibacter rubeus TaxID=2027860 RepID=A0AAE6JKT2_9SPHI|nr:MULTISPECIES: hypothetical protein [Mucilaginibacter]QEM07869.1 hypothetical protein DIU31_031820 [Mucilaginibacter rubeus]QEM20321.1 hypothetical protein DIU38_031425 [Mucilaginibacter gossypii]QTE42960.1 hypothetical protein J3L19_29235 [Mucilaginibacter rubeus]QTE49561.1 hypothetical protein J3L21_29195 [Mucilaginibacter rubeus]QTE54657.1 hypothetical protein J3L23_20820 [Mucilaginibacter rubeus]